MCLYTHTPFKPSHSDAIKRGIIQTELTRLLRTNSHESNYFKNVRFLFKKLSNQCYPLTLMNETLKQRNWTDKISLTAPSTIRSDDKRISMLPF